MAINVSLTLNGEAGKEQQMDLNLKGKNPLFYGGHPVNLNFHVEGPLQDVLKYTPGGSQIPESIRHQIESYEKKHGTQ